MVKKKYLYLYLMMLGIFLILCSACSHRKDNLKVSDFPSIGSGLTEKELIAQVGDPYEASSNSSEVMQMQYRLTADSLTGTSNLLYDKKWSPVSDGNPNKYLLYKLENGKAMVAFVKDGNVVIMTKKPVDYSE